jgi:hypothetical protein
VILKSRKCLKSERKITLKDSDREIVTLKQLPKNSPVDNPSLRLERKAYRSRKKSSTKAKSSTDRSKGSGSSSGPDLNDRSSKQVSNCSNMSYINTVNHVTNLNFSFGQWAPTATDQNQTPNGQPGGSNGLIAVDFQNNCIKFPTIELQNHFIKELLAKNQKLIVTGS